MNKKIYITGMHSGQNPSAGLGIAKCVRRAFPDAHIVGVDHWQGSSGLHDPVLNEVTLLPQWNQIDDPMNARWIKGLLEEGHLWLPALDVEIHWLAENIGSHPGLLAPSQTALEATAKPEVRAFSDVGFEVPEWISADLPDSETHAFLRHHAWQCWIKTKFHDAKPVGSWAAFERSRESLKKSWRTSKLFLQRHRVGLEESIAFAAWQGKLVGAVRMEKRQITPAGKTWAGRVMPVDPETLERVSEAVRALEWSGGGELEYSRDTDGRAWIIECNPRFPAWIYGATFSGFNLPGNLVAAASGAAPKLEDVSNSFPFFTRIVTEIPVRESIGLPLLQDPSSQVWSGDSKFGKGGGGPVAEFLPNLGRTEEEDLEKCDSEMESDGRVPDSRPDAPVELRTELEEIAQNFAGETPARVFLPRWAKKRFQDLARRTREASQSGPAIRIGYSVKTSPTDEHLKLAQEAGFLAECISQSEVKRAVEFGFPAHEVILNGPGKFWPLTQKPVEGLHALYCDSVEEFERVLEIPKLAHSIGFRIRLPKLASRFGNELGDFERFKKIVAGIRKIPRGTELGFHFHMPSWSIGVERWMDALNALLFWCQGIERLSGVSVRRLDLGGGFFPDDLGRLDFTRIQASVHEALPDVSTLYFEPGRALTQETEAIVSRVLDIRENLEDPDEREWVVDACIAELPLARAYPHRLFYRPESGDRPLSPLPKGEGKLLGRICMEDDILGDQVALPRDAKIGDWVVIADAGAYERSMSYVFGRG